MASYVLRIALLRFVVMLFENDYYFSSSVPTLRQLKLKATDPMRALREE